MKDKKGSGVIVVTIVLVILFLIAVLVLVLVLNSNGVFKPKPDEGVAMIPLFVQARDDATLEPVESNYLVEYQNKEGVREVVSQGRLDNSWSEILVPRNSRITFVCWSNNYYLVKAHKDHTPSELSSNKSTLTCDMEKIGNLTISHSGNINTGLSTLKLNISTKDNFYKTSLCFAWTSGFLDVGLVNQYAICESGWLNWSEYNTETKEYTYLIDNIYRCGEDQFEVCEVMEGKRCKTTNENTPVRFKNKVDDCVYSGQSVKNGSYELELEIQGLGYMNALDYLTVIIYDKDRRWDSTENRWIWQSEINGEDISSQDIIYTIDYKTQNGG